MAAVPMFFSKYPYPANFTFVESYDPASGRAKAGRHEFDLRVRSFEGGVFEILARNPEEWRPDPCLVPLDMPPEGGDGCVEVEGVFDLALHDAATGQTLRTVPGRGFGVSGGSHVLQLIVPGDARYYGMGQKLFDRLELSGVRTKFWNTDVWSDFHWKQWTDEPCDPPYFSTPYVAVETREGWFGVLVANPGTAFISTPGRDESRVFMEWRQTAPALVVGSEQGEPRIVVVFADSLAALTRRLQALVGRTPLPPLWALGYHQSRWGYGGHDDLLELDAKFAEHEIPCCALWLDLDYMDGYRVFQTGQGQFPHGVAATAEILARSGRRIVPIIDPGVKLEPGYRVYDDGHAHRVFCENPEGGEFVGLVWPGETVFPDFTLERVRRWWAKYAREFRESGFGAAWVDMNDPSTGPVDPAGMLFDEGRDEHGLHRNQYALGMQMATRQGFLDACPDERPFLLSRSGCTGSSRYSAIWTGDNVSNEWHLRTSIPTVLGMSISGLPFAGPDIGGFGGDAGDELMARWMESSFLFPFFRNHATLDSRQEEPWAYPPETRERLARSIRLRYQFLPYLYQLFANQELVGDPILRPLVYHYGEDGLDAVHDQFLVGPSILQAPILRLRTSSRRAVLPGSDPWFSLQDGRWHAPGPNELHAEVGETPVFVAAGSLVPMQHDLPRTGAFDLRLPTFLFAVPPGWTGVAEMVYHADDGLSFGYRRGERSTLAIRATVGTDGIEVEWRHAAEGFGPIRPRLWVTGGDLPVTVDGREGALDPVERTFTGPPLVLYEVMV